MSGCYMSSKKNSNSNTPPEITPCTPTFPKLRPHWATDSPEETPNLGESGVETQYGKNSRGMWGGMFLFSVFITFIISWSPGITLLWVGILTLFLSTLSEFRTQARDALKEGLTQVVTLTGNKLGLKYLSGSAGEGKRDTPSPECLKLNVTAKEKRHNYQQR